VIFSVALVPLFLGVGGSCKRCKHANHFHEERPKIREEKNEKLASEAKAEKDRILQEQLQQLRDKLLLKTQENNKVEEKENRTPDLEENFEKASPDKLQDIVEEYSLSEPETRSAIIIVSEEEVPKPTILNLTASCDVADCDCKKFDALLVDQLSNSSTAPAVSVSLSTFSIPQTASNPRICKKCKHAEIYHIRVATDKKKQTTGKKK